MEAKQGRAYLDNSDRLYDCICDPTDKWNGWDKPQFTKDMVLSILRREPEPAIEVSAITADGDTITWKEHGELCTALLLENGRYELEGWAWKFLADN